MPSLGSHKGFVTVSGPEGISSGLVVSPDAHWRHSGENYEMKHKYAQRSQIVELLMNNRDNRLLLADPAASLRRGSGVSAAQIQAYEARHVVRLSSSQQPPHPQA